MGKARVVALVAVVVLCAVGATRAGAAAFWSESTATVTGSKDGTYTDELVTTVGTVKCSTPSYTGLIVGSTTVVTMTPSYSGCTAFGFPAEVQTNGCKLNVIAIGESLWQGEIDLECSENKEMTIVAKSGATVKCTVHIPTQTDVNGSVQYKNLGSGATREITLEASLNGIDYTHTAGTGLGACSSGSSGTGVLFAKAVGTGEWGSSHVGIFVS